MSLHLRGSLPHHTSEMTLNHVGGGGPVTKEEGKGFLPAADALCKTGESNVAAPYREEKADTHKM